MRLHAQWITGFVDGEGCFHVAVNHNPALKSHAQLLPEFTVVQHESDVQILFALKEYWKCGVVRKNHGDRMCYRVRSLSHLSDIIVPFFEKHPLKTKKYQDFLQFRRIVLAMTQHHHLTPLGFQDLSAQARAIGKKKESHVIQDKVQPLIEK